MSFPPPGIIISTAVQTLRLFVIMIPPFIFVNIFFLSTRPKAVACFFDVMNGLKTEDAQDITKIVRGLPITITPEEFMIPKSTVN